MHKNSQVENINAKQREVPACLMTKKYQLLLSFFYFWQMNNSKKFHFYQHATFSFESVVSRLSVIAVCFEYFLITKFFRQDTNTYCNEIKSAHNTFIRKIIKCWRNCFKDHSDESNCTLVKINDDLYHKEYPAIAQEEGSMTKGAFKHSLYKFIFLIVLHFGSTVKPELTTSHLSIMNTILRFHIRLFLHKWP